MPRCERAESLDALRAEAVRTLRRIGDEAGVDSGLHRVLVDVWRRREEEALASVVHGDLPNALVILDRALGVLVLAPTILARDEMGLEDLTTLVQAA